MDSSRIIPANRFRAVLNELEAIASEHLAAELRTIQNGDALTLAQQDKLDTYIAEEQQTYGLLTVDHLRDANSRTDAARIVRSANSLRTYLAS